MDINSVIYRPEYTHREFKNDLLGSDQSSLLTRITSCALSLLSLYTPLMKPLSLCCSSLRLMNEGRCWQGDFDSFVKVAWATAGVAATVFAHPLGMLLSTGYDAVTEALRFLESLPDLNEQALQHGLNTLNHTLYLSLFLTASLEIVCLSLAVQVVRSLYAARKEYNSGKYLEALVEVVMSIARGKELHTQFKVLQYHRTLNSLIEQLKQAFPFFKEEEVGRLGKQWQFPSDHLPVGGKVGDASVFSWNILSKKYLSWVYNDSQGLNGSMLTQLDVQGDRYPSLTKREELIIDMIQQITSHPEHHSSLIMGLQEVHPSVEKILSKALPQEMNVVVQHGEGLIYNRDRFDLVKQEPLSKEIFYDGRPLLDVTLQDKVTGVLYQVVTAHVPGDPNGPGRYEFARYLLSLPQEHNKVTIGLGDLNFTHQQMQEAFEKEVRLRGEKRHSFIDLAGNYPTNINPGNFISKRIDGIWASFSESATLGKSYAYQAVEILKNLPDTIRLMTPSL